MHNVFCSVLSFSMYIYSSEIKSCQVSPLWVLLWFEATVKLHLISNFSKTIWKIIMLFFYKTVCFSKWSTDGSSSFTGIFHLQKWDGVRCWEQFRGTSHLHWKRDAHLKSMNQPFHISLKLLIVFFEKIIFIE